MIDAPQKGAAGMADVWLVRHTETDWNRERRYQSRSDRPLTRTGAANLRAVVEFFREAEVAVVVSTGLARTDRLAAAIADQHQGAKHVKDPGWTEIDHGCWEGLTYAEVKARFGETADERFRDPLGSRVHQGETLSELAQRVRSGWRVLLRSIEGGYVVVTHATPIQVLLCERLGVPLDRYWQIRIDPGGISHVRVEGGTACIQFLNQVPTA